MKIKANNNYCSPVAELIDVPVEQGFAQSGNIGDFSGWGNEGDNDL